MAITTEMAQQTGTRTVDRVRIYLSTGTVDITAYYLGGAVFDQEKQRGFGEAVAGDVMLIFDNSTQYFNDANASSMFYGVEYINVKIDFSKGFIKDDGTTEYAVQNTLYIRDVQIDTNTNAAYVYCQDRGGILNSWLLNVQPATVTAIFGAGNVGNGVLVNIRTHPGKTVTESKTLTCTLGGGDGVATFSLSGTGDVATSGTEFTDSLFKMKFTIYAGTVAWAIGDTISFDLKEYFAFNGVSLQLIKAFHGPGTPLCVVWGLLTGYIPNHDIPAFPALKPGTPLFDKTFDNTNLDIDTASFIQAMADIGFCRDDYTWGDAAKLAYNYDPAYMGTTGGYGYAIGYFPYGYRLIDAIKEVLAPINGVVFINEEGKIAVKIVRPRMTGTLREFSDAKKITRLRPFKSIQSIVNSYTFSYRKTITSNTQGVLELLWEWSNAEPDVEMSYTEEDATSIAKYSKRSFGLFSVYVKYTNFYETNFLWHGVVSAVAILSFLALNLEFTTEYDALQTGLGDLIEVTDSKLGYSHKIMEVVRMQKDFGSRVDKITITCSDTITTLFNWCFLGSSAAEGDGLSPQAADYDTATATDKQFCYLSTTGSATPPLYYLWVIPFMISVNFIFSFLERFSL